MRYVNLTCSPVRKITSSLLSVTFLHYSSCIAVKTERLSSYSKGSKRRSSEAYFRTGELLSYNTFDRCKSLSGL